MQRLAASIAVLFTAAAAFAGDAAQPTTKPSFEELPATEIAGIATYGKPDSGNIEKLWAHFGADVEGQPGVNSAANMYGVALLGPSAKTEMSFCYIAGAPVKDAAKVPKFLLRYSLPAGTYAVFKLNHGLPEGVKEMKDMFNFIYSQWLPTAGYELAAPLNIERYGDKGSTIEILIPVQKK